MARYNTKSVVRVDPDFADPERADPRGRDNSGRGGRSFDDRIYADDETEFLAAIVKWKKDHNRQFPTWMDVLGIVKALGYAKQENAGAGRGEAGHSPGG